MSYKVPYYGHMFADNVTQAVVIVTDSVHVEIPGGFSGDQTNGFTFQNSKELKCNQAGKYLCVWSLSAECGTNNVDMEGSIMINGTEHIGSSSHTQLTTANHPATMGGSTIVDLVVNDLVSMCLANIGGTEDFTMVHASLTMRRVS